MCGRFTQYSSAEVYAELFGITTDLSSKPHFNITPGNDILACRISPAGGKELVPLHWGLVPSWSKGPDKRFSMINARAETVAVKPAYRAPFRHHRCLIPADGFYEWHQENGKQPYYIHRVDDKPMVFAGLWDHWDEGEGDHMQSCTIIVCEANKLMRPIHERMPVILNAEVFDDWLRSDDSASMQALLQPYTGTDIEMYPVSREVNYPKNNYARLLERI
ncbi:MAG: SOS response-associated peptidase [Gammaproteobacteria bacterium]|nr:SOS response-associated peptidase [Gammaproteobacteria bacterium]